MKPFGHETYIPPGEGRSYDQAANGLKQSHDLVRKQSFYDSTSSWHDKPMYIK